MGSFSPPSREDAARWMRDVGILETLEAAEITPSSWRRPCRLGSLLEVVEFLVPFDDPDRGNTPAEVNFLDVKELARWTRDSIGDAELADRIYEIVGRGNGYASMVPELRQVVLERVTQCWELLKSEDAG